MIIPKTNKKIKTKYITNINDIDIGYALITKGHHFIIIGEDEYGLIIEELPSEHIIYRGLDINDFIDTVDLETARFENNYLWHDFEYKMPMLCSNYAGYCDYCCDLKKESDKYGDLCVPISTCVKYINQEKLENGNYKYFKSHLKYLISEKRKKKIKRLLK